MRVLLVNTSEKTGGAAIAASRLLDALNKNGVKAQMLVVNKQTDNINVIELPRPRLLRRAVWALERAAVWVANRFSRARLFELSPANVGFDITGMQEFRDADVVHLHWVNQGFLSLRSIRRIIRSGKPIVWTMHDMWEFTGICQMATDCDHWKDECGHCPKLVGGGSAADLSHRVFARKRKMYEGAKVCFVGCSRWMRNTALQSTLLGSARVEHVPNPLNTTLYAPGNAQTARTRLGLPQDKLLLLFTAYRITDPRKGFDFLVKAMKIIEQSHPALYARLGLIVAGKEADKAEAMLPGLPVYAFDYVTSEKQMINLYTAADMFAIPTLFDNLPNTVAEAMACGKPVVGFDIGGLPEMIDHMANGYLARYKDEADLAQGIATAFEAYTYPTLSQGARRKAMTAYSEHAISMKMIQIYNSLTRSEHA